MDKVKKVKTEDIKTEDAPVKKRKAVKDEEGPVVSIKHILSKCTQMFVDCRVNHCNDNDIFEGHGLL